MTANQSNHQDYLLRALFAVFRTTDRVWRARGFSGTCVSSTGQHQSCSCSWSSGRLSGVVLLLLVGISVSVRVSV
eukprot:gene5244-8839_t